MEMKENTILLSVSSYNQIKAENTKFQMFMSRLFENATLRSDYSGIDFDPRMIEELIHLCYPDSYKKKLSSLRTQQTKLSLSRLKLQDDPDASNDNECEVTE